MKRIFLAAVAVLALTGCEAIKTATTPVSDETMESLSKIAFAQRAAYAVSLEAALPYVRLPRCGSPQAVGLKICSSPAVVRSMRTMSDAADLATLAGVEAVQVPNTTPSVAGLVVHAARTYLEAFRNIVALYKGN